MKKTFNIPFFIFALLLIAAGCQQKEIEEPVGPSNFLKASIEHRVVTKSHIGRSDDGKYYALWTAGDELAVYVDGVSTPDKYALSQGAGTEKGVFAGTVSGNRYVALYPYSDRAQEGLKDNVLSLELPAIQVYSESSFGEGAFPMLAVCEGDELPFKNLCAALKVSMTGVVAVKSISFVPQDESMAVSGPATVRTDFEDAPELVMSEGGSSRVTLKCGSIQLREDVPTDFYIVIPAGTYKGGFSVEVETFSGTFTRTIHSDVDFARSQLRYIAPFRCDADGVIDPDDIPYNQIWYTHSKGLLITPPEDAFDRKIVSNTYENGKGVLVFDGPVTRIGTEEYYGFLPSNAITGIILPNSVEFIGDGALAYTKIKEFHTPDNLKSVGVQTFSGCEELSRIYGPLASDDEKALILPGGIMTAYAFAALGADLTIPDGVTHVVEGLFDGFDLETVTVPESLVSLGDLAIRSHALREFKGSNEHVPDGRAFINPDGRLVALAGKGLVDYEVPAGVKNFPYWIFNNILTLRSITFPKLSIGTIYYQDYFRGCDNLEFIYGDNTTSDNRGLIVWDYNLLSVAKKLPADYRLPSGDGLSQVNSYVFSGISGVERVTLPDEIKYLGWNVFEQMPDLKAVQMPADLVDMGYNTFYQTPGIDTLYLRSYAPPSYEEYSSACYFGHDGLVICVPEGFEELYLNSEYWSDYSDYIQGWHYDDLPAPDYYISSDYSRNGEVKLLQKAKKGRGIDIVLMGDAFSDRQVEDGTYDATMNKMMEAFFSEEPYTTYRDFFNVYAVTVISATEGYDHAGHALSGWFGNGTEVGGNDTKCFQYALNAVSEDRMDDVLVIVAMNSTAYGGTCYMYYPSEGDYSRGSSVAYFPIGSTDEGLAQLVHHEAGGHGFAKLDDEYAYEYMGTIPQDVIDNKVYLAAFGWWKNVDFTSDPKAVKWAHFLTDDRYKYDGLGVFEGACTYWKGAWRPTFDSIMRYNTGGFNAPSREAIWYRIHKLAYGEEWDYSYEDFVSYDAKNRKGTTKAPRSGRQLPPLSAPHIIE